MRKAKVAFLVAMLVIILYCFVIILPAFAQIKTGETAKEGFYSNGQTSTFDSLKQMLLDFQSKIPDSSFQKTVMEARMLLEKGTVDSMLVEKLLGVQDVLFKTQLTDKKKLLQYTLSVVHLLRQSSPINARLLATALNSLANAYKTMGDLAHPGPLYDEALALLKNSIGVDNIDYADILIVQGVFYTDLNLYDKALSNYLQAEEIYRKQGKENLTYADLLNSEGLLYVELGAYEKALPLYEKALAIYEKNAAGETPDYAGILNNKANLYEDIGLYQEAVPLFEKIIALDKKNFPQETPDQAVSIYNFGYLYNSMGQFAKALPMYQHALSIIEKQLGKNNDMYAVMLDNLGELYQSLGQYIKSEAIGQEAFRLKEKVFGKNNINYAKSLNNLGALYIGTGRYQKALPLLQRALQIMYKKFGAKNYGYATALNSLGTLYSKMGLHQKAFLLFDSALKIRKEVLGENHPDYATSLNSLAGFYEKTGKYNDALTLYQQSLATRKKALGELHPEYANSLNNLGLMYLLNKDNRRTGDLLLQAHRICLQNISSGMTILSEDEKLKLLFTETPKLHYLPSLVYAAKLNDAPVLQQLYNTELIVKGMVLQDQQNVLSAIRKSGDSVGLQQYEQWKFLRRILGREMALPIKKRRADLDSLQDAVSEIEENLSRTSLAFRNQQFAQSVTLNTIAQQLSKGEAAIEFIRFRMFNKKWKDSILYAAMILLPKDTMVRFVPLFEEKQLLQLLQTSSGGHADIFSLYPDDELAPFMAAQGSSLFKLIWKPLEQYLHNVHTIYYAPTGLLHRIAFAALRKDDKHLLIDNYQMNQLLSTRTIAMTNQLTTRLTTASVWGGIQYNLNSQKFPSVNGPVASRGADISFNLFTNDLSGHLTKSPWPVLPGTKKEMINVSKVLKDANVNVSTINGAVATEEAFKALDGKSPQILHLATHGFFLPVEKTSGEKNAFTVQQNPMFRSGLVLAGANRVWLGKTALPGKEDGILTAYEISQMDLSNTELVVLSACETALGDIQGNEGVIGLQRAFKMAGVKQMMVSLWRIPDEQTNILMTLFYKNRMSGQTTKEALRNAQLIMRKKNPPYSWAGFVLVE